ncbi:MAG: acyl-CoA dehydrogenase family protein [Dehalococcoidia bacterium]
MNFELTEEQKMLQTMVRGFANKELAPVAAKVDETGEFPAEQVKKIAELGLMGLTIPEEYGGGGKGVTEFCIAIEEMARVSAAIDGYFRVSLSLGIVPIRMYGNEAQKRKYLPAHASGEKMACFGLTEASAGSDPASMQTTATRCKGGYLLNGNKLFISIGAEAEIIVVFATIDKSLKGKGITAFIVDKGTHGFSVGKLEHKMGFRGLSAAELIFQDCFVTEENRLGEEGRGLRIALEVLDESRVTVGAEATGIAQGAFDAALSYAKERKQFGQAIANFQAIQWMLVDMATKIEAARLLTYQAAYREDHGLSYIKEAAMAKVFASEMSGVVTSKAMQIHGGYGYTKDYPIERFFRDAKLTEIYEGTSEIQRMTIARHLLKD